MEDRKSITITDENYDYEFERICDEKGFSYGQSCEFVETLPEGFSKQQNDNGGDEWVKFSVKPNIAIDCTSEIEEYWIAFEFANGFMIIYERDSMYD